MFHLHDLVPGYCMHLSVASSCVSPEWPAIPANWEWLACAGRGAGISGSTRGQVGGLQLHLQMLPTRRWFSSRMQENAGLVTLCAWQPLLIAGGALSNRASEFPHHPPHLWSRRCCLQTVCLCAGPMMPVQRAVECLLHLSALAQLRASPLHHRESSHWAQKMD